jgi:hypothetical protein
MKLDSNPIKKATFIVAFLFSTMAYSAKTETYKDIIEKSYSLSLQKNRAQAVQVLVSAIRRESKKSQAVKELMQALEEVSTVFYSEKAQQQFELALSLRMSEPQTALGKLSDAAALEPENLSIALAQMRLQISLGDCASALQQAQKIHETNPYSDAVALAYSQAAVCTGQFDSYLQMRNTSDVKKPTMVSFWTTAEIEYLFKTGNFQKAKELAQQLSRTDSKYPEAYYWSWKTDNELKLKADKIARKYVSICKTITSKELRNYFIEPNLCKRTADVEAYLKKSNTSG